MLYVNLKAKVKPKQSKVENNTANLIQSAPISMANLTGKSEHQPAKNKVIKTKNNQKPSANIMEFAGYIIRDLAKDIIPLHLFFWSLHQASKSPSGTVHLHPSAV